MSAPRVLIPAHLRTPEDSLLSRDGRRDCRRSRIWGHLSRAAGILLALLLAMLVGALLAQAHMLPVCTP